MVKLVGEAMDQFSETTVSNAFLVDAMPARMLFQIVPFYFYPNGIHQSDLFLNGSLALDGK